MRGKAAKILKELEASGITPAYAGKRQVCPYTCESKWDHPRLCGEKAGNSVFDRPEPGSPPPMRGKVTDSIENIFDCGITPAYAGKRI